jgi:hypothetical protein
MRTTGYTNGMGVLCGRRAVQLAGPRHAEVRALDRRPRIIDVPGRDVVGDYVTAEYAWLQMTAHGSNPDSASEAATACEYVRAIEAYVVTLRACGRQIPHRMDETAATIRALYQPMALPVG